MKTLSYLLFALYSFQSFSQSDTLVVSFGSNVLSGKFIEDYTNKWKVFYIDSTGKSTLNRIWTDYGQLITLDEKKYIHRVQDLYDAQLNLQDTWINMVEHETLRPVSFSTISPTGSFSYTSFAGKKVSGSSNKTGEVVSFDETLELEVFDWNLYGMLLVGLPFDSIETAKIPIYNAQSTLSWVTVYVLEKELIKVGEKNIETRKIKTDQGLTFWLTKSPPYVIALELELPNKSKLRWEMQ